MHLRFSESTPERIDEAIQIVRSELAKLKAEVTAPEVPYLEQSTQRARETFQRLSKLPPVYEDALLKGLADDPIFMARYAEFSSTLEQVAKFGFSTELMYTGYEEMGIGLVTLISERLIALYGMRKAVPLIQHFTKTYCGVEQYQLETAPEKNPHEFGDGPSYQEDIQALVTVTDYRFEQLPEDNFELNLATANLDYVLFVRSYPCTGEEFGEAMEEREQLRNSQRELLKAQMLIQNGITSGAGVPSHLRTELPQIIEGADKAAGVVLGQTAVSFYRNFSKTRQGKRYNRVMEEFDRRKELSADPLAA